MKKLNAIGYVRISGRDQSRYSLDSQETAIRYYCKDNGLNLLALFKDNGARSFSFERMEWIALERFVKTHKGAAQYLIIVYYDRFSRNISDPFPMIDKLQRQYNIKVLFRNEPIDIDPEDPIVFMQRVTGFVQANFERLIIKERTKQGLRRAMEEGRVVNAAAFGYRNHKNDKGKSHIVVDPERAKIIQKIFRDFIAGMSITEILREVKKLGFTRTGHSAIKRVLTNCVYAGLIKVPATSRVPLKYVKALHQPLVSEEDFSLVQEMLGNRHHKTQPEESMPLRGIIKCSCGAHMTAGWSKGRKKHYLYYRCIHHPNINISGEKLHQAFEQLIDILSLQEDHLDYIRQKAMKILEEHFVEYSKLLQLRGQGLASLNQKIEKLEDKMINDEIDRDFYNKWHSKYTMEKEEFLAEVNDIGSDSEHVEQMLRKRLPYLLNMAAIYREGPHEVRKQLIHSIFKYGISYSGGVFKAAHINPIFEHVKDKIKESGLLVIESPKQVVYPGALKKRSR